MIIFADKNTTIMTDQIKLLNALARKIKSEEKTKAQSLQTLVSAGILTKSGNFSTQYGNLGKIISKADR